MNKNYFDIISKHLDLSKLENIKDINTICLFTGKPIKKGIHKKYVIKSTFTDLEYLKYNSDYVSVDVAATMSNIIPSKTRPSSLRNFSFLANDNEIKLLARNEMLNYLIEPLYPPFFFCLSFNNKKHLAFKSSVNFSKTNYKITTDIGDCIIDVHEVKKILPVIQKWYTVVPEKATTKAKPTYFTKEEILKGCKNINRIEKYKGDYFAENAYIESYRNTLFLKILVHCLIKINKSC